MKVLLDTNIIIHREASTVVNKDIGQLFKWVDRLKYTKCVHPITVEELKKNLDPKTVKTMSVKLESYYVLQTLAPKNARLEEISQKIDKNKMTLTILS